MACRRISVSFGMKSRPKVAEGNTFGIQEYDESELKEYEVDEEMHTIGHLRDKFVEYTNDSTIHPNDLKVIAY
jgi:hypothetical protein